MIHALFKMLVNYFSFISLAQRTQDNINHFHLYMGCNRLNGFTALTALCFFFFVCWYCGFTGIIRCLRTYYFYGLYALVVSHR